MRVAIETIRAARRRGWSIKKIARAAGVSHQAIAQRLGGCEERRPQPMRGTKKIFFKCDNCGKGRWMTGGDGAVPRSRRGHYFCCYKCAGEHNRRVPDATILAAIDLRRSNNSWTYVRKTLGFSQQGLQRAIWRYLHEHGMLTHTVVFGIWSPPGAPWRERNPSWRWIERATGIVPSYP